jgi:hypothetical protein
MMHFMRPPNGAYIRIVTPGEPFEPLVNNYIMYDKIGESIGHHTEAGCLQPIDFTEGAKKYRQEAGNGEDHEKPVVLLKKTISLPVVIFMEVP